MKKLKVSKIKEDINTDNGTEEDIDSDSSNEDAKIETNGSKRRNTPTIAKKNLRFQTLYGDNQSQKN